MRVEQRYLHVDGVVVACEGIKGSELRPADTQLLLRLLTEATDICPHQRDAQQVEGQHTCRREEGDLKVTTLIQTLQNRRLFTAELKSHKNFKQLPIDRQICIC